MTRIPIAFGIDNTYMLPVCVVIVSLEETKRPETEYIYYIVCSEELNATGIKQLNRIRERYPQLVIETLCVSKEELLFAKLGILENYTSLAVYTRLLLPYLLTQFDKCIYLDSDIVVRDDLQSLYETDIENYYIAGVRDYCVSTTKVEERKRILQIESLDDYINAGVTLINLKEIRKNFNKDIFLKDSTMGYPLADQDIINKRFWGHIKKVSLRYNLLNRFINRPDVLAGEVYEQQDILEAVKNPVIIHFTGERKPWIFRSAKGCTDWWKYADKIINDEERALYRQIEETYEKALDFDYILARCGEKVIVWGASEIGRKLRTALTERGVEVIAFGDNNQEKQGQVIESIPVIGIYNLHELEYDSIIVSSQNAFKQIRGNLLEFGIPESKIIRYVHKGEAFYMALDSMADDFYRDN